MDAAFKRHRALVKFSVRVDESICEHGESCTQCCWLWQYGTDGEGYAKVWMDGKFYVGTRLLWYSRHSETWPEGLILHTCDVKRCMNHHHHYSGDKSRNALDALERGKQIQQGETHAMAKLSQAEVDKLRELRKTGMYTIEQLCNLVEMRVKHSQM